MGSYNTAVTLVEDRKTI